MADKNSSNIFEFPELSEYSYFDPGLHIYGKFENSSGVAKPRIAGKSSSKTKSVNKAGQVEKKIKQNEQINKLEKTQTPEKTPAKKVPEKTVKQEAERPVSEIPSKSVSSSKPVSKKRENKKNINHGFHSISTRLIGIISVIIVISMSCVTFLVSHFVGEDVRVSAEANNLAINQRAAREVSSKLNEIISAGGLFYEIVNEEKSSSVDIKKNAAQFFERNKEIAAISFLNDDRNYTSSAFFATHEIESELYENYLDGDEETVSLARNGIVKIQNVSPVFNTPLILVYIPLEKGNEFDVCAVLFSSESIGESFGSNSLNANILVNSEGVVLVHPDEEETLKASDFGKHPLIKEVYGTSRTVTQSIFKDEKGEKYFGALNKIQGLDAAVITEVKVSVVMAAVYATTRRNIYLTIAILAVAILITRFLARSISSPIELLTEVTDEIAQANFDTPLFDELDVKRKDEIGILNRSTKDEQRILNTVTSLTNRGVTQAIVTKKIDFEPHLKDITIFFSDIRGFTAISDGFNKRFGEKSAAEIIGFLNDYMSRMVNCIKATGGIVDKFEGDAIMACWGVLRDDDLSYEQMDDDNPKKAFLKAEHEEHVVHDVISAIRATVGMRYALMKYNKDAEVFTRKHAGEALAKYKPYIKIGCGLNTGRATVGFMGSKDKMEFTSIGDAVNLASRTESSNKPCGTDILLSEDTYNLLKKNYVRCAENNFTIKPEHQIDEIVIEQIPVTFEVKGKGKQHFYGVVNMPEFDIENFFKRTEENFQIDEDCKKAVGPEGPKTLNQLRALLDIPVPDFSGVNLDAEENKVKIS